MAGAANPALTLPATRSKVRRETVVPGLPLRPEIMTISLVFFVDFLAA
jgi:hypothetical protein